MPAGVYVISQTLVTGDFRGLVGDGKTSSTLLAKASPAKPLSIVIDATGMQRGTLRDFRIDCNGSAQMAIKTDYTAGGPSLNNSYSDIFIENYLVTGWQAHDNNDCYFDRILITNSPKNSNSPVVINQTAAFRSVAAGGPLQFLNCNFLNDVYVAAQYINFTNCVTAGITVFGAGFNVLSYTGGYAFSSASKKAVIFISESGNAANLPSECGPITFTGSHIEINEGQFLINTKTRYQGAALLSGKLHYGVNAIGCHIAAAAGPGGGGIISPTVSSSYFPFAVNKFANCWFSKISMSENITSTTDPKGTFQIQYENCYSNSYYLNEPRYLSIKKSAVSAAQLALPGIGEIDGAPNNFFRTGAYDGASYDRHNMVLQGHWGMGLNGPSGQTTGYIDFRRGKIDLKTGFFINNIPALTLDKAGFPNISGLAEYPNNTTAKAVLGIGKLYHSGGTVKITV